MDASPHGLGAMLVQTQKSGDDKVIAYASRSLNDAEKRYSQIERECLAFYFACIRFQMYLLGITFTLYTDHKPLIPLLNKPKKSSPFRIERMRLRLQGFKFNVEHLPGKLNPTDYTSRHPVPIVINDETCISEELNAYVNKIIKQMDLAIRIEEIQNENVNDNTISKIIQLLENGKFPTKHDNIPDSFIKIWDELSVSDNLLLKQERLVIPEILQKRIVQLAHEGHLGIMNTKRLLRSKVWFKNLDSQVENEIKNCHTCQATVYKHEREPLTMSELPSGPWEHVNIDFFGPLPSGDYILEVVDQYSRWVELEVVRSTAAKSTIPKLDKIFSAYGIPYKITTDNGPPFHGKEFKNFTEYLNIEHKRVTPVWPQANSSAENFNRRLRKIVQSSKIENKNWQQEIYKFLRNYRATPHSSIGKSPAEVMFPGRTYRTKLPQMKPKYDDTEIREMDRISKAKSKWYADRNRNVKESNFKINDTVLVKQKKLNKLTPPFNPNPYTITSMKGSMITARSNKTQSPITRNSSFFKQIPNRHEFIVDDDDDDNDNEINDNANRDIIQDSNNQEVTGPRRNPPRERNRPLYLRDDIRNQLSMGN